METFQWGSVHPEKTILIKLVLMLSYTIESCYFDEDDFDKSTTHMQECNAHTRSLNSNSRQKL